MDKTRSKIGRPSGCNGAENVGSVLEEIPVPNETGAIPADDLPASVHDDFSDLRDIDFSQYIADNDDNAGSMNSPSSPSVGMMSKTPFKTPVPSEYADDPIELDSSPGNSGKPLRLRDYLPGLGSSVEPSFAMDDSQQTKVIAKATTTPKVPANSPPRYSYSLSVSSDDGAAGATDPKTGQLPVVESGSPSVETTAPTKGKKARRAQKAEPPKKSTRNRKINGKKKPVAKKDGPSAATKQDETPVAGDTKDATPPKQLLLEDDTPVLDNTKDATPSKRPLLARMLSCLSEPGSLKWEEPLVGGRDAQSPIGSDGLSAAQPPSSPSTAATDALPDAGRLASDDGSRYSPSIPASFADPFEFSQPPGGERACDSPPTGLRKKQGSPILRLDPDAVDSYPPGGSPSNSPIKGARKGKVSPEKRGRQAGKATAPSKRRRVQDPVKKRVVQPRPKAKVKAAHAHEVEDKLVMPATNTHEPQPAVTTDVPHTNSRTLVSETGSPTRVNPQYKSASPAEGKTNGRIDAPSIAEDEVVIYSPRPETSITKPLVNLKPVFQAKPRGVYAETVQVDNPERPKEKAAANGPEGTPKAPTAPKSQRNPKGMGEARTADKTTPTNLPSHAQPVARAQENSTFKAFRQHILGQLTTIEASQQHDHPSDRNDGPETGLNERVSMAMMPQHMLGGVLRAVTEKTLEYVTAKEKDLESIAQEYQSGVAAFIDRVERLHQVENSGMVKALKKQRQSFVESCEDGTKTCEGFMAKLDQCSLSSRTPGDLEKWLERGREMQKHLQGAEFGEA